MPSVWDSTEEPMDTLEVFYGQVDAEVRRLIELHAGRLNCRAGCRGCCVEGLTVFEVEAEHIRCHYESLLADGLPHPEGGCAFLDEAGACRIYEHRPYVCRTQGLPLRWIEEDPEGDWYEMRDICPENEADLDLLDLEHEACWTIGPFEERLSGLQMSLKEGSRGRIALRALFERQC
jgi:uncharacterized protein